MSIATYISIATLLLAAALPFLRHAANRRHAILASEIVRQTDELRTSVDAIRAKMRPSQNETVASPDAFQPLLVNTGIKRHAYSAFLPLIHANPVVFRWDSQLSDVLIIDKETFRPICPTRGKAVADLWMDHLKFSDPHLPAELPEAWPDELHAACRVH